MTRDAGTLFVGTTLAAALACGPLGARAAPPAASRTDQPPRHPVLVELFTSQGCSSCPAADAFVLALPRLGFGRDRVLPLTFHVDYWDGLGWKDPFATPELTGRQRDYAASGRLVSPGGEDGLTGLYTPQMIVAGKVHFSGRRRETALAEIERAAVEPEPASLSVTGAWSGPRASARDQVRVTARVSGAARSEAQASWRLTVAVALKEARTPVQHGENGGETLAEAAIVRWLSEAVPISTAADPVQVEVPRPPGTAWKDLELVAFVQSTTTRRIISARAVDLTSNLR